MEFKKYLISSIVTFVAAFSLYFVTIIDNITLANLTDGTLAALMFVGVRAGIKAVLEFAIITTTTK